jgi:hypothetical protein
MIAQRGKPAVIAIAALALTSVGVGAFALTQVHGQGSAAQATVDPTMEPSVAPRVSTSATPLPGEAEPILDKILTIHDASHVPMPLDPYMTSMDDIRFIDQAQDVGAASCMRSLGFTTWTADTIRTSRPEDYREGDIFEYLDPQQAAQSGYPRASEETAKAEMADTKREPTVEERKAYYGDAVHTKEGRSIPRGGCVVEADVKIYGKDKALPADPRSLAVGSRSQALGDSRVRDAIMAWRSCMQSAGITSYDHPVPASKDPKWQTRAADAPASAEEKRVASADANCRVEVNLVGIYKSVRFAYEQQLLDENKEKILESKKIFEKWVANAKAIIKAG